MVSNSKHPRTMSNTPSASHCRPSLRQAHFSKDRYMLFSGPTPLPATAPDDATIASRKWENLAA